MIGARFVLAQVEQEDSRILPPHVRIHTFFLVRNYEQRGIT